MLDGVVGEAPLRLDVAWLDDRGGRAGRNACYAIAAAVGVGRIGGEVEVGDQRAEEQPGTQLWVDEAAVLPDPADPRALRPFLLQHRPRIHLAVDASGELRADPRGELAHGFEHHVVVVASLRIARDAQLPPGRGLGQIGGIARRHRNHGARAGEQERGVEALRPPLADVGDGGPVPAAFEPAIEARRIERLGAGDPAQVEPQRRRLLLDQGGEVCATRLKPQNFRRWRVSLHGPSR